MSSIPHGQRAIPSATTASLRVRRLRDFRRRGRCVHTVNADVPVDSLPVWVAVRCYPSGSVVLHGTDDVTVESSARRFAAVDLEERI